MRIETGRGWTMVNAEAFAWLHEQPDASVDALVCDPPYSSGGFTRGDRMADTKTKYVQSDSRDYAPNFDGDNRDQRAFLAWCTLWLSEAMRVVRVGGPACLFTDWRQLPVTTDALQAGGFIWRGIAVWSKGDASRPQMGRFRADSEFVVWGSRGPMPQRVDVGVLPGTWIVHPVPGQERVHITQKPVQVMDQAVRIAPPPRDRSRPLRRIRIDGRRLSPERAAVHRRRARRPLLRDGVRASSRRGGVVHTSRAGRRAGSDVRGRP